MNSFFLGLDTSCYTTSLAVLDEKGTLVRDMRKMLQVKEGHRGLRQSEALFQHIKNLPLLFEESGAEGFLKKTGGIAASARPRRESGSYMPVFLAGDSLARSLAVGAGSIFVSSTHQEGHIMAGLWSACLDWKDFWLFHVSGGTTEVLWIQRKGVNFDLQIVAGGQDISAGQFIDRIGVKLGLPFPAGKHLEKLALQAEEAVLLPVALKGNQVSFSGPETQAVRLLDQGVKPAVIARSVEECIARSLTEMARRLFRVPGEKALFVGGVMANTRIKNWLRKHLKDTELLFASPALSGDNAVGLAEIARQSWLASE